MKALLLLIALQATPAPEPLDALTRTRILQLERRTEPPPDPTNRVADDARAAALGQFLFFDARLSQSGQLSCASCHDPARAFSDGKSTAEGLAPLTRNAPSLLDVARSRWLFWDGRADTLWSQALQPLERDDELGASRCGLAHHVHADARLRRAYEELFGALPELADARRFPAEARPGDDERGRAWQAMDAEARRSIDVVFANLGKAIEAYERRLLPRGSAFDQYLAALRADDAQGQARFPAPAGRGLRLFLGRAGCRNCHAGAQLSDQEFHNTGLFTLDRSPPRDAGRYAGIGALQRDEFNARGPFSDERGGERALDVGQLRATPETWGAFKTPGLRNVARTAPYMHQGQLATLRDVLHYYSTLEGTVPVGHHGETLLKPLQLAPEEIEDLLAFLESLSDEPLDERLLRAPESPLPAR